VPNRSNLVELPRSWSLLIARWRIRLLLRRILRVCAPLLCAQNTEEWIDDRTGGTQTAGAFQETSASRLTCKAHQEGAQGTSQRVSSLATQVRHCQWAWVLASAAHRREEAQLVELVGTDEHIEQTYAVDMTCCRVVAPRPLRGRGGRMSGVCDAVAVKSDVLIAL